RRGPSRHGGATAPRQSHGVNTLQRPLRATRHGPTDGLQGLSENGAAAGKSPHQWLRTRHRVRRALRDRGPPYPRSADRVRTTCERHVEDASRPRGRADDRVPDGVLGAVPSPPPPAAGSRIGPNYRPGRVTTTAGVPAAAIGRRSTWRAPGDRSDWDGGP